MTHWLRVTDKSFNGFQTFNYGYDVGYTVLPDGKTVEVCQIPHDLLALPPLEDIVTIEEARVEYLRFLQKGACKIQKPAGF